MTACDHFIAQSIDWLVRNNLTQWASCIQPDTNTKQRAEPWLQALRQLPITDHKKLRLQLDAIDFGSFDASEDSVREFLLMLKPWRKGPFSIQNITIKSEWNCSLKWNRLQAAIAPLVAGRKVLDVGGGNGYFSWRCILEGAVTVLNIDSNPLAWAQWQTCQALMADSRCGFIPHKIETLPVIQPPVWDVILCMGVIYHSPTPFALLSHLRSLLVLGGKLVIETLVVEGDENTVFTPKSRYASMPNVWAIPSLAALARWLDRCGYADIQLISLPQVTTPEEQSASEWTNNFSLIDSLAAGNLDITIEGYSAPRRAIVIATKPAV